MATIHLKTSFFPLAFILFFFPAYFVLDGGPKQKVGWGENTIPVQPGPHQLQVFFPYLFIMDAGKSAVDLNIAQGQTVHVSYRAPWLVFLPGKITVA